MPTAIPRDDAGKLALVRRLRAKLAYYAPILEISEDELAQVRQGADWFEFILHAQEAAHRYTDALFACKQVLRDGRQGEDFVLPALPKLPAQPASEPFIGIFGFLDSLIARIKQHRNYIDAIGQVLGIEPGPDPSPVSVIQPVLTVNFQGGHPLLGWKNARADALELEADHATGSFRLLTIKMLPGYLDRTPLPPPGSPAVWRYRAIYRIRDEPVGLWSPVLEIEVKGSEA